MAKKAGGLASVLESVKDLKLEDIDDKIAELEAKQTAVKSNIKKERTELLDALRKKKTEQLDGIDTEIATLREMRRIVYVKIHGKQERKKRTVKKKPAAASTSTGSAGSNGASRPVGRGYTPPPSRPSGGVSQPRGPNAGRIWCDRAVKAIETHGPQAPTRLATLIGMQQAHRLPGYVSTDARLHMVEDRVALKS